MTRLERERGLGAVTAVLVLVALAVLAAAIVRQAGAAQSTTAQDVQAARAMLATRSGLEWGLYQAVKGSWVGCSNATQTLDLTAESGLRVTVVCDSRLYNEGESIAGSALALRVYTLEATACSIAASCPDSSAAVQPGYVERRLQLVATP